MQSALFPGWFNALSVWSGGSRRPRCRKLRKLEKRFLRREGNRDEITPAPSGRYVGVHNRTLSARRSPELSNERRGR